MNMVDYHFVGFDFGQFGDATNVEIEGDKCNHVTVTDLVGDEDSDRKQKTASTNNIPTFLHYPSKIFYQPSPQPRA